MATRLAAVPAGCRDAADERAERRGDHDGPPDVAVAGAQAGVTEQAHAERQQHRRDRHVGNPPRDERADDEESEQHAVDARADAQQQQVDETGAEAGAVKADVRINTPMKNSDDRRTEAGGDDRR